VQVPRNITKLQVHNSITAIVCLRFNIVVLFKSHYRSALCFVYVSL